MKHKRSFIFLGCMILVLILNHIFGWSTYISNMENMTFLKNLVHENLWVSIVIYMVLTIIGCVVLALPGVTFAILATVLFGPWLGTLCCLLATTIGSIGAFLIGRFFLKDSMKPLVAKNKHIKKLLFDETGHNQAFILMITRLVPLFPFNLQNFAYGVTDIKLSTYSLYTLLFMLPGTAMYTLGTAGVTNQENRWLYIGLSAILAIVVIGFGTYAQRKYVHTEMSEP